MSCKYSYEKNIYLYKYYLVFSQALFIWPIDILFFNSRGFNYTQIMLIESIISIVQLITEIPSGMIADRIGCKKTVLVGIFFKILAYLMLITATHFYYFVIYGLFMACGEALVSGADTALLYESHKAIKKEKGFIKTVRQGGFLKMIVLSFVTIVSSFLYKKSTYLPYLLSILFLFVAIFIIVMYKEVDTQPVHTSKKYTKELIMVFIKDKKLCWLVVVSVLFSVIFADSNYFLQVYMKEVGFDINYYGAIFFICNMISAIAFKNSRKISLFFGEKTKIFATINLILIFGMAAVLYNYIGVGILCLTRVWIATVNPLLNASLNDALPSNSRATLLSINAAIMRGAFALFDPFVGIIMDHNGIRGVFIIVLFICILLFGLLQFEKRISFNKA